jgi:hypothetical protein
MAVGAMEIGLFVLLGVLALVALVSLLVAIMFAFAVGVAPVLAGVADRIRRYRWRNWHPPTDWLPDLDAPESGGVAGRHSHATGVTFVSSRQLGTNVELLTAQLPGAGTTTQSTVTALHATLAPQARLELPEDSRDDVAVLVVSGTGTVGSRRHVSAGDLALLEPGEPVSVVAGDDRGSHALEVLVLGGVPSTSPGTASGSSAEPTADPTADPADERPRPHIGSATSPVTQPTPTPLPAPALTPTRASGTRGRPAAV